MGFYPILQAISQMRAFGDTSMELQYPNSFKS